MRRQESEESSVVVFLAQESKGVPGQPPWFFSAFVTFAAIARPHAVAISRVTVRYLMIQAKRRKSKRARIRHASDYLAHAGLAPIPGGGANSNSPIESMKAFQAIVVGRTSRLPQNTLLSATSLPTPYLSDTV